MGDSTTVTVGDTEVQITETADGFEVEEAEEMMAEDPEAGFYLHFTSGTYGATIPVEAPFHMEKQSADSYTVYWNEEDDIGDQNSLEHEPYHTDGGVFNRKAHVGEMEMRQIE